MKKNDKSYYAFNINYIFYLLGFAFFLWGNIYLLINQNRTSWFLVVFLIAFTAALFLDSVYYIFTKQEIYFVHFWGYKKRLPWFYVTSIIKHPFIFGYRGKIGYQLFYDQPLKNRVIRTHVWLALTPNVKKYLNKFYRGKITFETKRRKKKK